MNEMATNQANIQPYYLVYKCFLCGNSQHLSETIQLDNRMLADFLSKFIQRQKFAGHPYLLQVPGHLACMCKNGGAGLAYFAGVKKV